MKKGGSECDDDDDCRKQQRCDKDAVALESFEPLVVPVQRGRVGSSNAHYLNVRRSLASVQSMYPHVPMKELVRVLESQVSAVGIIRLPARHGRFVEQHQRRSTGGNS